MTTPLPAPSAGASLRVIIAAGKFHGVIIATTPTGGWWTIIRLAPDGRDAELAADAHRLLGVPAEELGRVGDLALGVGERLAVLAHDQRGQLVGVVDQDLPAVAQHLAALTRRGARPLPLAASAASQAATASTGVPSATSATCSSVAGSSTSIRPSFEPCRHSPPINSSVRMPRMYPC